MDRPIIFSAAMVTALLDGEKTQTRRLALSPLAKCHRGDRLWVRENFTPQTNCTDGVIILYEASRARSGSEAKVLVPVPGDLLMPRLCVQRPSIHMPRWASRLTLAVTHVQFHRLQDITEAEARCEGVTISEADDDGGQWWSVDGIPSQHRTAREAYAALWDCLHGEGSWEADPYVVALTFTVSRCNIDRMPPALAAE